MRQLKGALSAVLLMISDVAALLASFLAAYILRSSMLVSIIPGFREIEPLPLGTQLRLGFLYGAVIVLGVFAYERLYSKRLDFWEETRQLLKSVTVSSVFIMVLVFVSRQYIYYSRAVIVLTWLLALVVFPLFRLAAKKMLVRAGLWKKKILVLGTDDTARLVAQGIKDSPSLGYEVVGFLSQSPGEKEAPIEGGRVLGAIPDLERVSQEQGVKDFIITLASLPQAELIRVIERCDGVAESIRIVPNIGSLFTLGIEVENVGDVLALNLNRNLEKNWNVLIKNIFEYLLIVFFLAALLPVFLLTAILIKIDSRGPVFFIQDRLGRKGRRFRMIKFRSMHLDGDRRLEAYLAAHPAAEKEWERFQKLRGHDPRITRIGRILRRLSLDEIPQLVNVLGGDMSLVGPRPYLPREEEILNSSRAYISRVKPGITGLWQVRGRNLLTFQERILLDEYYIRNWSLWLDIVILIKTPKVLAKSEGAF